MKAAAAGDLDRLRKLLNSGAKVDERASDGRTALHFAKNADSIKLLIDYGADVNAEEDGFPVVETTVLAKAVASEDDETEIVSLLLQAGADVVACGSQLVFEAIEKGRVAKLECLLRHGVDVNCTKAVLVEKLPGGKTYVEQTTPLMQASRLGRPEIVHVLLKFGARKTDKDASGMTAKELASNEETVRALSFEGDATEDRNV
jgi:ankyrin repeat protein